MAPTDMLNRLKSYYQTNEEEQDVPVIAPQTAALISIIYTILYVLPFYLSSTTRPSPTISRDSPTVIRARIRAVTFTCVITTLGTYYVLCSQANTTPWQALHFMGWWPVSILDLARSFLLTAILFLGPLFERGVVEEGWKDWIRGRHVRETLSSWIGWRNFIAGPTTEEIVFRSTFIPLHLLAHLTPTQVIYFTPLYFGIAHIHHFYEYTLTHPDTPLLPALLRSLVQFGYTSVFGFFATFLYLRTASLPVVILVHSFCNWCGLPRFWGRVEGLETAMGPAPSAPPRSPSPSKSEGRALRSKKVREMLGTDDTPLAQKMQVADGRLGVGWTVAYYVLLVAGVVGFWWGFWPLTESEMALATF
ncbi:MAG: replication factor C subunit 4 [Chaenotheca gracillima]|nr:MAG: replication factor C subunit 4 [Chaenotheca gracillima]